MSKIVHLTKEQIDWSLVNIREKHGADSLDLWNSLERHGQLQPRAVWQLANGKYRILYGHRRALVLTNHNKTFEALVVPEPSEAERIEKQFVENHQRLDLSPEELEKAVVSLLDYYEQDLGRVAERIGRSRSWVQKTRQNHLNRRAIAEYISEDTQRFSQLAEALPGISGAVLAEANQVGVTAEKRAEVLQGVLEQEGKFTKGAVQKMAEEEGKADWERKEELRRKLLLERAELLEEKVRIEVRLREIEGGVGDIWGLKLCLCNILGVCFENRWIFC
jgi:ParB/RepB/Spo0J family partition protein